MNILITGGTGYIGKALTSALIRCGAVLYVTCRCRPEIDMVGINWIEVNFDQPGWTELLPKSTIDVVYHLAQSKNHRNFPAMANDVCQVNVMATVELVSWARENEVRRFIYTSTGNVYGINNSLFNENSSCEPNGMYASSKFSAELFLKPFQSYMEIVVLRLFGVYGFGQHGSMLQNIFDNILNGSPVYLAKGVGVRYNPIHITDCVSALLKFIEVKIDSSFEIVNIGGNEIVDLSEFVNIVSNQYSIRPNIVVTDATPVFLMGDINKLVSRYGFAPCIPFTEGVADMTDNCKLHPIVVNV